MFSCWGDPACAGQSLGLFTAPCWKVLLSFGTFSCSSKEWTWLLFNSNSVSPEGNYPAKSLPFLDGDVRPEPVCLRAYFLSRVGDLPVSAWFWFIQNNQIITILMNSLYFSKSVLGLGTRKFMSRNMDWSRILIHPLINNLINIQLTSAGACNQQP